MMNDDIYKQKYLKYKKKYISLQQQIKINQKGGDANLYIDLQNKEFIGKNNEQCQYIIFHKNVLQVEPINGESYFETIRKTFAKRIIEKMGRFMTYYHGKLNLDFMNDIFYDIFYDLQNIFEINTRSGISRFKNDKDMLYKFDAKTITSGASANVYFLNKKNLDELKLTGLEKGRFERLPDRLALKYFKNDKPNINKIPVYTSLWINSVDSEDDGPSTQATKEFKEQISQQHTWFRTKKEHNIFNLNGEYNDVKLYPKSYNTPNYYGLSTSSNIYKSHIMASTSTTEFINDVRINCIIHYLLQCCKTPYKDNYLSYVNFFITNYNDNPSYFIVMETQYGALDNIASLTKGASTDFMSYLCDEMINQIIPTLTILKGPRTLFTHTDMKMENIFYNIDQFEQVSKNDITQLKVSGLNNFGIHNTSRKIHIQNPIDKEKWHHIKLIIADFDRASITFRGIRFFSSYSQTHSRVLSTIVTSGEFISPTYYNLGDDENHQLNLYTLQHMGAIKGAMYPSGYAQIPMRYSPYPFYWFFDIQSLFISFFYFMDHTDSAQEIRKIILNNKLMPLFPTRNQQNPIHGALKEYGIMEVYTACTEYYDGLYNKMINPFAYITGPFIGKIDLNTIQTLMASQWDTINANRKCICECNGIYIDNTSLYNMVFTPIYLNLSNKERKMILFPPANVIAVGTSDSRFTLDTNEYMDQINKILNTKDLSINTIFLSSINPENFIIYTGNYGKATFYGRLFYSKPTLPIVTNRYSSLGYLYEWDEITNLNSIDSPLNRKFYIPYMINILLSNMISNSTKYKDVYEYISNLFVKDQLPTQEIVRTLYDYYVFMQKSASIPSSPAPSTVSPKLPTSLSLTPAPSSQSK